MSTSPSPKLETRQLFKSRMSSCSYIFRNGKRAVFQMGCYITSNGEEITELLAEIANGHPTFYQDPNEIFVSEDRSDPIAALRKRIAGEERAKLLAEMQAATDPSNDFGTSAPGVFTPASTSDIAPVAIGGDASARLTGIKKSVAAVASAPATSVKE